jgi:hypothetical protein
MTAGSSNEVCFYIASGTFEGAHLWPLDHAIESLKVALLDDLGFCGQEYAPHLKTNKCSMVVCCLSADVLLAASVSL